METITLPNNCTLNIPSTGRDWQLFTSSMDCTEAASALTEALKVAFEDIKSKPWTKVYECMQARMYPVMEKYSSFGAWDSEPRGEAEYALQSYKEALMGDE